MPVSAKLRADFKSALAEAEALKLADERTEEQTSRLESLLKNVLPDYKAKIEKAEELDRFDLEAYKDLENKTIGTPFSASVRQAGAVHFDGKGEAFDEGEPGNLTDKQFKSISDPKYGRAFKYYLHYGDNKVRNSYPSIYKTLVEGIDEGAGFFVPPQILNEVIQRQPAPTSLRGRVRQLTTASNRVVMLRTSYRDDINTSPINGQWTGEAGNPSASPEPTFGEVSIPVHEYMGRLSMSNTLLEDSGFNLETYLNEELAKWLDLHYERHLAYGTGVGQPRGIWNSITSDNAGAAQLGRFPWVKSADASLLTADVVKSMRFEILPQYARPNFSFIMNQKTAKAISLFKSAANGTYLYTSGQVYPGIVQPTPDQIDGFPITYCQYAPDVAANAFPVFFGSLEGVFMPVRLGMSIRVLNEIEAIQNRRVYLFRLRWGAETVQEQYGKFIKVSA